MFTMLLLFSRKLRIAVLAAANLLLQLAGRFCLEVAHGGKFRLCFGLPAQLRQDLAT